MSKMRCVCGYLIIDNVYPCETEAYVLGQQDWDRVMKSLAKQISELVEAAHNGQRDEWLQAHFGSSYSVDEYDDTTGGDLISKIMYQNRQLSSECRECGRLWVQKAPGLNEYFAYKPDNNAYNAVYQSKQSSS